MLPGPRKRGSGLFFCSKGNEGRGEASAPTDSLVAGTAGRCGERTERCRWQRKRSERVAAVKILSGSRKAAQKFWAPQQDHRPLRKCILRCVGEGLCPSRGRGRTLPLRSVARSAVGRADVGIGPYRYIARGAGREESPSHGFAVPAPFRQGGWGGRGYGLPQPVCALASQ